MIDFRSGREPKSSSFDYIQIRIASPEEIRGPRDSKERERLELQGQRAWWSWGEVTKPETINYRSFKPERDGLFCERIFGPVKDWECHCGKYKRIRYRGVICDRCGVEVTLSKVRRERMGHIELAVPVAHIWFFKTLPSPMGNLLDMTLRDLERVIYYTNYVVIEPGEQEVQERELLDEDRFLELRNKAKTEGDTAFRADIGSPAIRLLLERINVDKLADELRDTVANETSQHRKKQMLKRLKIVDAMRNSGNAGEQRNDPRWMILDVVPVIPPDLRPLVPLDGGRFATSDLNDLYRRVINRNNRLQKLILHRAPEVILRNEKRMLQEAVDALFDNGRRSKAIRGRGKRPLKSLSDMLKGKQGRFRQNLLGKRVDYSGRSVLVEGKAIRIHPLVCAAFNADFDGDQMAVHVPLSFEAQLESRLLMISSNNILKPSDGRPVAEPSQDMVLGCHFLTKEPADFEEGLKKAPRIGSMAELEMGIAVKRLEFHSPVQTWHERPDLPGRWVATTAGRVIFNSIVPVGLLRELGFQNKVMRKKDLSELVFESYRRAGLTPTVQFLDQLKEFGFRYATIGGVSIGVADLEIPTEKSPLLHDAENRVERFQRAYATGQITFGERYNKVIDAWTHANNDIAEAMVATMRKSKGGFNPVFLMFDSGSRGSRDQIRQLAGMRGLMAKPQKKLTGGIGEIIESPIKSNFREGLSVLEYFISTHGARQGLADTALKTADAGYLTRRLVDVAQDVTITEEDCGTILGLEMSALKEGEDIIEPLRERLVGCVALDEVSDPHELDVDERAKVLVEAGKLIDEETAQAIEDAGIEAVRIRSVLTCEAKRGVCRMCYGRNLATMDMVDLGEAVGILAAQSIGEPGTQLTLRTFHIGGTAARNPGQTVRTTKVEGVVEHGDRLTFVETPEKQKVVTSYEGELILKAAAHTSGSTAAGKLAVHSRFQVPLGATLMVDDGQDVYAGQVLARVSREAYKTRDITGGLPRVAELFEARRQKAPATISEVDGVVRFGEIKRGKREIWVHPEEGEAQLYEVPAGKHLRVHEGDRVRAGDRLTEGPVNPHDILRIKGPRAVQEYLLNEVQEVYRLQGVKINDKHIGVIVRQMLQKVKVVEPGDTEFLEGENVDKLVFSEINERAVRKGGKPSTREPLLLGITKASF